MSTFETFKLIIFRYYKHNIFKLILTCLGISLGLALFITTRSYSDTILSYVSEQTSIKSFGNYSIKSQNGKISFDDYQTIVNHPFLNNQIAKIEFTSKIFNHQTQTFESLNIVGLDMVNLPAEDNAIYSPDDIEQLFTYPFAGVVNNPDNLIQDSKVTLLNEKQNIVLNVISDSNIGYTQENFLFLDLAAFYTLFTDINYLNEIDVTLKKEFKETFVKDLAQINIDYYLTDPSEKAQSIKKLSDSFSVNLIFLSTFAILVSLFISYQFFNFTSASRNKLYQKLLALGMQQKRLLLIIIIEIGLIFLVSFMLSLFFGSTLAKLSLGAVKQTISLLYFPINPSDIIISKNTLLIAFIIGFFSYLFNIIEPILTIRFQQSFFRRGYDTLDRGSLKSVILYFLIGFTLIFISIYFIFSFITLTGSVYGGYINMFLYLFGVILTVPLLIYIISNLLKKIKNPFFSAALMSIEKYPLKNIVTISALALAFSLYLSLGFFINSFRTTVIDWIEYSNWADVYIYNEANQVEFEIMIDEDLLSQYITHPDVKFYDFLTHYQITYQSLPTSVIASHHHILENYPKRLKLFSGHKISNPETEIYISESFRQKFNVDVGDQITLTGDLGTESVTIKDIFYSYGTDRGLIQMTRQLGKKLFKEKGVHGLGLKLNKSIKESTFISDFEVQSNEKNILLSSNEGLRDRALEVFDQTFKITWMLAVIAGLIATLSLINYVSITLIDRSKELIQIRSMGAKHGFLRRFILSQVFIITFIGFMVAMVITVGVLHLLIETINKPVFGWTIQIHYSLEPLLIISSLSIFLCFFTVYLIYFFKRHEFDNVRIGHEL